MGGDNAQQAEVVMPAQNKFLCVTVFQSNLFSYFMMHDIYSVLGLFTTLINFGLHDVGSLSKNPCLLDFLQCKSHTTLLYAFCRMHMSNC